MSLSCLIVEDHAQAREWLSAAAAEAFSGSHIVAVDTVTQALAFIGDQLPSVALVDLGLPDGSGLDVIEKLDEQRRQQNTSVLIVVSTMMNDEASLFNAIRAGADGYILKEEPRPVLIDMLRGISNGKPPLSASVARMLLGHFRSEKQEEAQLSPRETQVLQLLAKGYTVKRVADMLDITANTASGYVKEIYRKLNVNSRAEATLEASKRGLV